MKICEREEKVRIVHSWFGKQTIFLTATAGIYVYLLDAGWEIFFTSPTKDLFLPGLLICISFPLLIFSLTICLINQTNITIGNGFIEIKSFPLPFPARRVLTEGEIIDIYARKNIKRKSLLPRRTTDILALSDKGIQKKIIGFFTNSESAEAISREMKKLVCKDRFRSLAVEKIYGNPYE